MRIRAMPIVGGQVVVRYLDATVEARVERVDDDAKTVVVRTAEGERLTFKLNPAIARFTLGGETSGAQLLFR
jgi:uncharacterized membrane protein